MKQLFQDRKTGRVELGEVSPPALAPGSLLVRTAFSAVSPGTERAALGLARKSLVATARERPDLVRRVIDLARREGPVSAWRQVRERRSGPMALGYSSAGTVLEVGDGAGGRFRAGDRVACAGTGHAVHAELACVPAALSARLPEGLSFEAASFATLGAIAMHAVRQAEVSLGERVGVIGLGLVGQLVVQQLVAAGCRVAAFDLLEERAGLARAAGAESALGGDAEAQARAALSWSDGRGLDAVIVAAAAAGEEPMAAAAAMARDRGRVVALGLVPFGLPREVAFEKELELRIARSYGPGRYDDDFELRGRDYPIGQVRWTETRNLEAVLHLMARGELDPVSLVTHRREPGAAAAAYEELVDADGGGPLAILLEWPQPTQVEARASESPSVALPKPVGAGERIGLGLVGAGAFAKGTLLPLLRDSAAVDFRRVVTRHGLSAQDVAQRFGFAEAGTDPQELFADESVQLALIATRHDSHAALAAAALQAGRHVFVEKPLALSQAQLALVEQALSSAAGTLTVGFNRRFSPHARALRAAFEGRGPLAITIRVAAGPLPSSHWLADPDEGGGRLLGEGCHFVDLMSFLAGDPGIDSVEARPVGAARGDGGAAVLVGFADGSVGELLYLADAAAGLSKERVEVHGGGASGWIDDFTRAELMEGKRKRSLPGRGKGHPELVAALLRSVREGASAPVPPAVLLQVSRAVLAAAGRRVDLHGKA
jgi:predicted dehydrogenase